MMALSLEAVRSLAGRIRLEVICITGPFMPAEQRRELERRAEGLPVRVLRAVEDVPRFLEAADLVVTMGGYNTLTEAVRLSRRILVMPRAGPSAEQRLRSEIFSRLGLAQLVDPDGTTAPELAARIESALRHAPAKAAAPDMNGLDEAARHLLDLADVRGPQRPPETRKPAASRPAPSVAGGVARGGEAWCRHG